MKQALLVYGYGLKNAGDMAITIAAIDLLRRHYSVTVVSRFDEGHPEYERSKNYLINKYSDIQIVPSPFRLNRSSGIFKKTYDHLHGGIKVLGLGKKTSLDTLVEKSSIIVFNGGNLFRCQNITDFARLSALMYPLKLAKKNNIPYLIFPQSASTINWLGKIKLLKILGNAEQVWTREDQSYEYLKRSLKIENLKKSIDLAFYINSTNDIKAENKRLKNNKNIAITLRSQTVGDLKEFDSNRVGVIKRNIIQTIRDINKYYDATFLLVVQTHKDKEITEEVFYELSNELNISFKEEYDPIKLIDCFKECNLLIGMRLHSIILALNSGTPAIGYFDSEWGLKNPGLMQKFNMPYKLCDDKSKKSLSEMAITTLNDEESFSKSIINKLEAEKRKFEEVMSIHK